MFPKKRDIPSVHIGYLICMLYVIFDIWSYHASFWSFIVDDNQINQAPKQNQPPPVTTILFCLIFPKKNLLADFKVPTVQLLGLFIPHLFASPWVAMRCKKTKLLCHSRSPLIQPPQVIESLWMLNIWTWPVFCDKHGWKETRRNDSNGFILHGIISWGWRFWYFFLKYFKCLKLIKTMVMRIV